VVALKAALGQENADHPTLDQAKARLALVYERQCTVSRENGLTHLGIAVGNVNGTANLHFTKFNDSVPNPLPALRVDNLSMDQLCAALLGAVAAERRLHATQVLEGKSYHKYWGGQYSANVNADGHDTTILDGEYTRMVTWMETKVTSAKTAHGRVGTNANAQHTPVGP
jgi:hypothetical protein